MTPLLQEVRAKVIEAVPDITELKFGCRIEEARAQDVRYVGYSNRQHALNAVLADGDNALLLVDEVFTSTILGRPITLADVLRAVEDAQNDTLYAVDADGEFWSISGVEGAKSYGIGVRWNLALSLDEQEPEVIAFLHKVLV